MSVGFASVHKKFGEVHAVNDLSFEVGEGEFLVLVGPSGCGKTTALRMIAGLEEPTSGEVYIAGRPVTHVEPRDRDIAMVFQSYALYPHMSVRENLSFGMKQRRTPKDEIRMRVQEAAEMLDIGGLLERRPRELSGGQRQRVALGRAIVRRPRVFLMDEPLSNLDAQLRLRTRAELSALHRRLQTTFVYVTHDQVEAITMGTRIAVMRDGVLQQIDSPQRIYDEPANTFVATFIGSPAMNLIPGVVAGEGGRITFRAFDVVLELPAGRMGNTGESQLTLGLRPEHFSRTPAPAPEPQRTITGPVSMVEPHGSDLFVSVKVAPDAAVTARLDPGSPVRLGETIHLMPDLGRVQLFVTKSGRRVAGTVPPATPAAVLAGLSQG